MAAEDYLIQYIVVRGDLKWPIGALIAQGCHAASAVMHMFQRDPETQHYLEDLDRMHKCVLKVRFVEKFGIIILPAYLVDSVENGSWIVLPARGCRL